jgi:hypothetical protein
MIFALKTFVVEAPSGKISLVFSFESAVIMVIVGMIMVMPVPGGVSVIGMSRVMSFKKAYAHLDLGICRTSDKTSRYDQ